MKLYYFQSPNGRRPCAVAKHLGSPVTYEHVDLASGAHKTPEFLAINPNGKIPVLVDGDKTLWESYAIMCHLAQKAGSDLWPDDKAAQIDVIRWMSWDLTHFSRHAGRLFWENFIKPGFMGQDPDPAEIEDATGFFKQFAAVLDTHLKGRKYIVGDKLSIADFGIFAFLPSGKDAKLPMKDFDEIRRWYFELNELEAFSDPWPAA